MRILCAWRPCASHYIRTGWKHAFEALGHTFGFYNVDDTKPSIFDIFDQFKPDIFIGETFTLNRAICKCIEQNPQVRVCMVGSNFGDMDEQVKKTHPEVLHASEEEKKLVAELYAKTGKPEFVFAHYTHTEISKTLNHWTRIGPRAESMLSACDTFAFCGGQYKPELACDIGFVGGSWGYKGRTLSKYLGPLCHPLGQYNIKIFGNQPHSMPQYLGLIDDADVPHLFKSAKILPNVSEEHSQVYGFDIIERIYKVLGAGGGLLVTDKVSSLYDIFNPDEIVVADNPEDFRAKIDHYLKNPEEREAMVRRGQLAVLESHTYLNRALMFFVYFGLTDEIGRYYEYINERPAN
jgi:glycosyltransferase involved in cell wall biosynthesis